MQKHKVGLPELIETYGKGGYNILNLKLKLWVEKWIETDGKEKSRMFSKLKINFL